MDRQSIPIPPHGEAMYEARTTNRYLGEMNDRLGGLEARFDRLEAEAPSRWRINWLATGVITFIAGIAAGVVVWFLTTYV